MGLIFDMDCYIDLNLDFLNKRFLRIADRHQAVSRSCPFICDTQFGQ
jgi:hypothetical protein